MKLERYRVYSSCMECLAILECSAFSQSDAWEQFVAAFKDTHPEVIDGALWARTYVKVSDKDPDWKLGNIHYSGPYSAEGL